MESDESRIYNAAHLMVASLAGSLAHVTCKVSFFKFYWMHWYFIGVACHNFCEILYL